MNKKVISSVLAGAMAVSTMGVVASAATGNTTEGSVALSAKAGLMDAVIDADLPQDVETFINPYGATVAVTNGETMVDAVAYSDGIISPTYTITNHDSKALKVSATAKITPSSTVAVNTKVLDDVKLQKATEKQVFAFLNTTTDTVPGGSAPVFTSTSYNGNATQLAFTEDGAKAANIMTVAATGADGDVGYFYVGGQCTPNPETAWDNKDTVTIDLILDLSPSAGEPADLSVAYVKMAGKTYADFLPGTYTYNIAATGSKTKAANLTVKANDDGAVVYVKYNGEFLSDKAIDLKATGNSVGDVGCTVGVQEAIVVGVVATVFDDKGTSATDDDVDGTMADYKAGDKLEFIVYNATTNESATYTFNFTE